MHFCNASMKTFYDPETRPADAVKCITEENKKWI